MSATCSYTSYAELLAAPYTAATARLRGRIRQAKKRKKLGTHEAAFQAVLLRLSSAGMRRRRYSCVVDQLARRAAGNYHECMERPSYAFTLATGHMCRNQAAMAQTELCRVKQLHSRRQQSCAAWCVDTVWPSRTQDSPHPPVARHFSTAMQPYAHLALPTRSNFEAARLCAASSWNMHIRDGAHTRDEGDSGSTWLACERPPSKWARLVSVDVLGASGDVMG